MHDHGPGSCKTPPCTRPADRQNEGQFATIEGAKRTARQKGIRSPAPCTDRRFGVRAACPRPPEWMIENT